MIHSTIRLGTNGLRKIDPACGTCRRKCRKCDRSRPICNRCRTKGLHCEGYPPRFEFCDIIPARRHGGACSQAQDHSDRDSPREPDEPAPDETLADSWQLGADEPGPQDSATTLAISPLNEPTALGLSTSFVVSPPNIVDGDSPGVLSSPVASSVSPRTFFSETYARLDQVDLLGHRPLINHCKTSGSTYLITRQALANDEPVECHLVNSITIATKGLANPFSEYILPLAYQHDGVLHALLGLSACHMHFSGRNESQQCFNTALRHRLAAIRSLGSLLPKEETSRLSSDEEEAVLAMVLLLVFHDVSHISPTR